MNSLRQIRAFFLILLLGGSFFLHTFVHHSSCCSVHTCLSVRKGAVNQFRPAVFSITSADFFCPVCAGMMNADLPSSENRHDIPFGQPEVFSAFSDFLSTPDWLLPSPRAPPAFSAHA